MLNFEVHYTGADKVREWLNGLGEAFGPSGQKEILRKVGALYLNDTEKRFEKQVDPDRKKWKPLSPTTIRIKKQTGSLMGAEHIGVWTGNLASSLQMRISGDSVFIGSNIKYAPWFHYGVKRFSKKGRRMYPWGTIPPRRFLGRNTRIDEKVIGLVKKEVSHRLGIKISDL